MLICGLILGAAARFMDIYCENLGEIFSQMSVFALFSPVLAYFTWMAKQPGALGKLISVGVLLVSVVLNFLMFGDPDVFNLLINAVLFYILFIKKIPRKV